MKKIKFLQVLLAGLLLFIYNFSFAQTPGDTVKTGKANDPMVVNPGKANDNSVVSPDKPHDAMAVMTDTGFINKNIADNMMEIQLSRLGRDRGNAAVKKVANQLITDHTAILSDLKKLAAKKGNGAGTIHNMAGMTTPDIAKGADFNAKWASEMLTMHEAKIDELEKFSATTLDADIKAAIAKALPKIKAHRDMLEKIPGAKVTKDPNAVVQ